MTRRDTIIVAVLINAGLLVMLFISALKNDSPSVAKQDKKAEKQQMVAKKETPIAKSTSDQVDQILAQYSKKAVKESAKEEKKIEVSKAPDIQEIKVEQEEKKTSETAVIDKKIVDRVISEKIKETFKESTAQEDAVKVVVKKGDVLEKIAKIHGTTVGALMQANQLTDSRLQIGQVLHIPKETQSHSTIKALPQKPVQAEEKYYVVKNGDNLWKIAIENHLKVEDLLRLNQLNEKQAKALRPGDRLRIK